MVDGWSCACALGSASSGQGGAVRYRCRPSTWLRHSIFLILFFVHTHFLSVGNSVSRPSLYTNICGSLSHDFNGGSLLPLKTVYFTCGCRMLLHQNLHTTMPTASVKNKMGGVLYFFLPFPLLLLLPQPDVFLLHLNRKSSGILIIPTLTSWYTERWECCSSSPYS